MAITEVEAPRQALQVLINTTQTCAKHRWFQTPQLKNTPGRELTLGIPHPMYVMSLASASDVRVLAAANLMRWRCLVFRGGQAIAMVEAVKRQENDDWAFFRFAEGTLPQAFLEALLAAEQLPQTGKGAYEIRMLEVHAPELNVGALWLKDLRGNQDLLIPILGELESLHTGGTYTESQFIAAFND